MICWRRKWILVGFRQYVICTIAILILETVVALPQTVIMPPPVQSKPYIYHKIASESVLYLSKRVGVSPLAVCTGTASFISGFDVGIIAGALLLLAPEFGLGKTPHRKGMVATASTVGAIGGTIVAGKLADAFGRRTTLLVTSCFSIVGSIFSAYSSSFNFILIGRLISGLGIGHYSTIVPIYIAECAESKNRGTLATVPQLMVSSGIAFSYIFAVVCMMNGWSFRVMFGITTIKALLLMGILSGMPESPRWLVQSGRQSDARTSLEFLRKAENGGAECIPKIDQEFEALKMGLKASASSQQSRPSLHSKIGLSEIASKPSWRDRSTLKSIFLCIGLQSFQQLSGVNAIIYFTPTILQEVRVTPLFQHWLPWLRGKDNECAMLATFLSYFPKLPAIRLAMGLMDRVGRRRMLLRVVPCMVAALLVLAGALELKQESEWAARAAFASVVAYGIAFSLSLGPLPGMLAAELLPYHARGVGMSMALGAQWTCNTLVSFTFPLLQARFGTTRTLLGYAAACVAAWFFVWGLVPETSGLALEAVSRRL